MTILRWQTVLGLLACARLAFCKDLYRPRPDEKSISVPDLVENQSPMYDPRPTDLDIGRLMMELGRYFDTEFMSIDMPPSARENITTWKLPFKIKSNGQLRLTSRLPKSLRRLRLNRLTMPNGSVKKVRMSRRVQRKMLKYLHARTHCAVRRYWKDLGVRYWPRWVRAGSCDSQRSCSIPAGMTCQPARNRQLTLLRWHCQDYRRRKNCKWLPSKYPVLLRCKCSCRSSR